MQYLKSFLNKQNLTIDEFFVLLVSSTVFMPFYMLVISFSIMFFYLVVTKKFFYVLEMFPKWRYGLLFSFFSLTVSSYFENLYGIGVSIVIFQMFLYFGYYRYVINKKTYYKLINIYMIMSLICFTITIINVLCVKFTLHYDFHEFIEYMSLHRPNSSFFNTNYYATICEFIILISMYYFLFNKNKKRRIFFFTVSSLAFIVLLLTGNRTALPTILIASLILSFNKKNRKIFIFLFAFSVIIILLIKYYSYIFPRYEFASGSFNTRVNIWKNSVELLKNNFLFGNGPLSYKNANFIDYPANHSHNIILDILINFGVVGIGIIFPMVFSLMKSIINTKNKKFLRLVIAITSVVIIHGILDVTIFWHQTSYIYFSIVLATDKINKEEENYVNT